MLLNAKATDGNAVVAKPTAVAEKATEQPVPAAAVAANSAAPQGSLGSAAEKAAEKTAVGDVFVCHPELEGLKCYKRLAST